MGVRSAGRGRGAVLLAVALAAAATVGCEPYVPVGEGRLVSVGRTAGSSADSRPVVSGDGRYAVYGDGSGLWRRDLKNSEDLLVTEAMSGDASSGPAGGATVSHDGCRVAFHSSADDLVEGDTNGHRDVFVRDLCVTPPTTERLSLAGDGTQVTDHPSSDPVISADGSTTVFVSSSGQVDPSAEEASESTPDVFAVTASAPPRRISRLPVTVTTGATHTLGTHFSDVRLSAQAISADGSTVVFGGSYGGEPGAVAPCTGTPLHWAAFAADVDSGATSITFAATVGCQADAVISADGSAVVVRSVGGDGFELAPPGGLGRRSIVLPAPAEVSSPSVSADGGRIAFASSTPALVSGDTNTLSDVFTVDVLSGTVSQVSVGSSGPADADSDLVSIASGRTAVYRSAATNLDAEDTSSDLDVFATGLPAVPTTEDHGTRTVDAADAGNGPETVVSEGVVDGLRVQLDGVTNMRPGDLRITPSYNVMTPIAAALAGPVFDIEAPADATLSSATITLPYVDTSVGELGEDAVRIWTFDETLRVWRPVPGEQVIDPVANTVTTQTTHLSMYAVFNVGDSWHGHGDLFAPPTPYCAPPSTGNGHSADVVLALDRSWSMEVSDPLEMRAAIPDGLAPWFDADDQAAVVYFDDTVSGSTTMEPATGMADWDALATTSSPGSDAYDGSRPTDVLAGLQRALDLVRSGTSGGTKSILLISDGGFRPVGPTIAPMDMGAVAPEATYLTLEGLIDEARAAGVRIHTFDPQASPWRTDIRTADLARATGGLPLHALADDDYPFVAVNVPEVVERFRAAIQDAPLDSDGDGLTDCEETSGMYAMVGGFDQAGQTGYVVTTDPTDPDTDGDDLDDGEEMERRNAWADGIAGTYPAAFDSTEDGDYFVLRSHPRQRDTDGDGLNDGSEVTRCAPDTSCDGWPSWSTTSDPLLRDTDHDGATDPVERINRSEPDVADHWWGYGNGLDVAPFTLFQPASLGDDPAIAAAWQRVGTRDGNDEYDLAMFNPAGAITWSIRGLCVDNCAPIDQYLEIHGTDNGSGVCIAGWFGSCLTLEEQEKRLIRDARLWQGVFESDGRFTKAFLAHQVEIPCSRYVGGCDPEVVSTEIDNLDRDQLTPELLGVATANTVDRSAKVKPLVYTGAAGAAIAAAIVASKSGRTGATEQEVLTWLNTCTDSLAAKGVAWTLQLPPCEVMPVYLPGRDAFEATEHIADAIWEDPERSVLRYRSAADTEAATGLTHEWINQYEPCTKDGRAAEALRRPGIALECDEWPPWASDQAGPGASLRLLRKDHNGSIGGTWGGFATKHLKCKHLVGEKRVPVLIAPDVNLPRTGYYCPAMLPTNP